MQRSTCNFAIQIVLPFYALTLATVTLMAAAVSNGSILMKTQFHGKVIGNGNMKISYCFGYVASKPDYKFNLRETIVPLKDGSFNLNIPLLESPDKVYYFSLQRDDRYYTIKNLYIEPGDSIYMTIDFTKDQPVVAFFGKGAAKLNCWLSISEQMSVGDSQKREINRRVDKVADYSTSQVERDMRQYDSLTDGMLSILRSHKGEISAGAYNSMLADILTSEMIKVGYFWLVKQRKKPITADTLLSSFRNAFSESILTMNGVGAISPGYNSFLVDYITTELYLRNGTGPTYYELRQAILARYRGDERARLLYILFTNQAPVIYPQARPVFISKSEQVKFLQGAIDGSANQEIKTRLMLLANSMIKGAAAFPFNLENPQGKGISLNNFSGKYVLMHLWFTGCNGCAVMHERIDKLLKPKVHDPSSIAFVSICTDESRSMWLASLEKEIYNSRNDINLYTNGEGFSHPMIKYYGLVGLPFVALIDPQGNIVCTGRNADAAEFMQEVLQVLNSPK